MIKRLIAVAISVVVVGALASPAFADNGAQKVQFQNNPFATCTGPLGGTPSDSFAVIKTDGNGTLSAEVSFKDENPNATYDVFLYETPSCEFVDSEQLTTNGQGNGNVHLSGPLNGATDAFVFAYSNTFSPPYAELQTPEVFFGG